MVSDAAGIVTSQELPQSRALCQKSPLEELLMLQQTCLELVFAWIEQSHVRKLPPPHNPDACHRCERASHLFYRKFEGSFSVEK